MAGLTGARSRTRARTAAALAGLVLGATVVSSQPAHEAAQPRAAALTVDVTEANLLDLQRAMTAGRTTSRAITAQYLARIEALDRSGPTLRAVIERNPDALALAEQRDAERRAGRVRGPLHGIPVLLKDNIATGDRMLTTAGSLALAVRPAPRDAFLVRRLRDAGAVLLGKTNLSEWANFRSTHSSSGWSARGGQTRNAYAADRNPSGSSSGSAVAVAASLATVAVGTETDGSIVSPASVNGIVGIKPTLGLISRTGIVPIAHSQDTAGPMGRTVADAAALLTVLAGPDPSDPVTLAQRTPVDYAARLDRGALQGARIGVVRNRLFGHDPRVDALAEAALDVLRARGAVVVDPVRIDSLGTFDDGEFEVLMYEFKDGLARFFAWWGPSAPVRSLGDVIAFNAAHAAEEMPFFGQELMEMSDNRGPLTTPYYLETLARNRRLAGAEGIDLVMRTHHLDALVAPTGGPAWPLDTAKGDGGSAFTPSPSTVTSVAGYPHVTVPMGWIEGLPVGLSFFGRAWSEVTLLRLAHAYEQATRHRRPPRY